MKITNKATPSKLHNNKYYAEMLCKKKKKMDPTNISN